MTNQRSRSAKELRALYASQRARGVSLADGPGFLYAFVEYGHRWKIGMTDNYDRRKAEWDQSLAHILLELKCFKRPRIQCTQCVTSKNSSSLENGDEFGEGRFGQCLCALDLRKAFKSPALLNHQEPLEISEDY
ncbi:hypothetical protein C8R41DRAFT_862809 [Lentinula lateritia]|uniref:Uncharacterized protein n=1 Tax=Lentinula lateritia TaxID=40482 RepID=A0ABQ8VXQ2_9AGAR|nr:hypothetical protein C8R41DRAFT_862809 [Lentinula lateritia]